MKTEISVFPWANIGQNDHSNPYIKSTTVLSDIIANQPDRLQRILQRSALSIIHNRAAE